MNWLNLPVALARSPEFIGSEPSQRSTWFSLLAYCAEQENGGVIPDCRAWKDRRWQQTAAVTVEEVMNECDLFWWDGDSLSVAFYPAGREAQVIAGRVGGYKGGRPRKPKNPSENPSENPKTEKGKAPPKPEEKIREDNGSEEKGKEATAAALAERLCLAHPSKALTQPALLAALATLRKHPFEKVMAGTVAYAVAVAEWTSAERVQFVKNPEAFFRDDIWNQPAENWKSRTEARRTNGANGAHVREIDVGGRRPAGVMTAHLE